MSKCPDTREPDSKPSSLFLRLIDEKSSLLTSHAVVICASLALIIIALAIGGSIVYCIIKTYDVGNGAAWCFGTALGAVAAVAGVSFFKQGTP